MAIEYARVLKAMGKKFTVVGRGKESANIFYEKTGTQVVTGGIEEFINKNDNKFHEAIIATGVEQLSETTKILLNKGVSNILLEKPVALFKEKLIELDTIAQKNKAKILIAYNRRFYASVTEARAIIEKDGGVVSFQFDFTEWSHIIEKISKPDIVKQRWFLSNSTHVADMAFFLGGKPQEIQAITSGSVEWHKSASIFAGIGKTENENIFSYASNWDAPGRWSVEILTRNFRLIFKPLEQLSVQKKGSVNIETVTLNDELDKSFKPGVYKMVECFLNGSHAELCSIQEQIQLFDIYCKMANYCDAN